VVLSASPPLYPPFFNSLARLGGTDKEHLRLGHSLKRDFTSCLTVAALSCPSLQIFFLMSLPLPCPSCPSFPLFPSYLPPTLRVFFSVCLVCLILLGLVLFFFFPDIRSFLFTGRSIAFQEKLGVARLLVDFFPLSLFFGVRFLGSKKASKHSLNQHSFESNLTLLRFGSKLEFFLLTRVVKYKGKNKKKKQTLPFSTQGP